jgi:hypothetical protein
MWRELTCIKWLSINWDKAYKKIISCKNFTELKTTGKCLFKAKCKWETKVWRGGGDQIFLWLAGRKNFKCENGLRTEIVIVR